MRIPTTLAEFDELLADTRSSDKDKKQAALADLVTFTNTIPMHPRNIFRELLKERVAK